MKKARIILGLLAALILMPAPARTADLRPSSLDRPVRLNLWGARLSDFVQEARAQTGVEILLYPPDFPAVSGASDLYLVSGSAPLRAVLECLARRFGFRYRVSHSGRVEISKGYDWANAEPALRFRRLDAVAPPGGADPESLSRRLREFIKPLPLLNGEYSLTFEKSPAAGNPDSIRAVMALPPTLADYLEKGIACLSGEPGDFPRPAGDNQRLFAVARRDAADWEKLLGRQVAAPRAHDLRAVLADICDQAAFVVALAGPPADGAGPADGVGGTIGLGRITEDLAKRHRLGKRVFLAGGSLVFEKGAEDEWETDSRVRELYWGGLAVAGFDARGVAARFGSDEQFLARLRARVFPELWRDPACAVVYSNVSGRLAVVAPMNAVEALAAWLNGPVGEL